MRRRRQVENGNFIGTGKGNSSQEEDWGKQAFGDRRLDETSTRSK
jgi:hypothetical protein